MGWVVDSKQADNKTNSACQIKNDTVILLKALSLVELTQSMMFVELIFLT